ncbi:hypothetical protein WMY93_026056 [Mugilogobius chulae]|uniref:Uncharacterized protein n=1 Tax=Mugilogobius chulae TaxID=88201 RepID=A0AAW0N241_9GOBI
MVLGSHGGRERERNSSQPGRATGLGVRAERKAQQDRQVKGPCARESTFDEHRASGTMGWISRRGCKTKTQLQAGVSLVGRDVMKVSSTSSSELIADRRERKSARYRARRGQPGSSRRACTASESRADMSEVEQARYI